MKRRVSISLVFCLCLTLLLSVPNVLAAPGDGAGFEQAVLIEGLGTEYELDIPSSSSQDCRYYKFVPAETATYVILTRPSMQEVWVQMYSSDDLEHAIDGHSVWNDSIEDFGIAHALEAGKTYYFSVGAYFSQATGNIRIEYYDGVIEDPVIETPENEIDQSSFESAVELTQSDREYAWSISNTLWDENGDPVGDFEDKYYKFIPAETAIYTITSKPALYDSYLTLYVDDPERGIIEIEAPSMEVEREDGVWDFVVERDFDAGQTYYIRVSAIESGDGILLVSGGTLQNAGGTEGPTEKVTLTTTVGVAGYTIGGVKKDMTACYYKAGDTYMPIRLLEGFGVSFKWDAPSARATMSYNGNTVVLTIGNTDAHVNGVKTPIIGASGASVKPELMKGRTMIPLRFVSQHLGFSVKWEPSHLITISPR